MTTTALPLTTPATPRILALDGVRGLAVLAVLVFHTLPIPDHSSPGITLWNAIAKSCWVGVDLFFVLSGFLITRVLCQTKAQPNYFRNFYLRRALRILPLYFAVLTGAIYLIPALIPMASLPDLFHRLIENQFWVWSFLQNFLQARSAHQLPGLGHFWTLAVEEQFYLLWPALVYWLSRRSLLLLCLAICALEPLARFACLTAGYSIWAIRQLTYLRLDSLLFGALLCLLLTETNRRRFFSSASVVAIATTAALLATAFIVYRHAYLPYESRATVLLGYSAVAILGTVLLYACLHDHFYASQFFSAPLLRWFGQYSYGIYVFSVPAILCFQAILGSRIQDPFLLPITRLLCSGFASVALAYLSWHVLESPFLRLKTRFHSPRLSLSLAATATSIT